MYKKSENAHRATLSQESTIALECVARANDLTHAWITYEAFECFSTLKTGSVAVSFGERAYCIEFFNMADKHKHLSI